MKLSFNLALLAFGVALAAPAAMAQTTPAPVPTTTPPKDDVGADGLKHRGDGTVDDGQTGAGKAHNESGDDRGRHGGRDAAATTTGGSGGRAGREATEVKDQTRGRERNETERAGHDAAGHETGEHGGHGRGGRG